jgi:hypothetical protein
MADVYDDTSGSRDDNNELSRNKAGGDPPQILRCGWNEYLAIDAINNSSLGQIAKSPRHFINARNKEKREATKAKRIGDVLHHIILDPTDLDKMFVVRPEEFNDYKTKAAREWRDAQEATIVTPQELSDIKLQIETVRRHPIAGPLLKSGVSEVTVITNDTDTGLRKKARLDHLPPPELFSNGIIPIVDIKTTEEANYEGFKRSIRKYGYDRQGAYYIDIANEAGLGRHCFVFIAIEKDVIIEDDGTRTFECAVYQLGESSVSAGREKYKALLQKCKECTDKNEWHGYSKEIEVIDI